MKQDELLEQKIIDVLKDNSRTTGRELAEQLLIRPDTVKEYFGRLKAKGLTTHQ